MSGELETLARKLGPDRWLDGASVAQRRTSYWNSAPMQAKAMLRPHSTAEVATLLAGCHAAGQSVVTHGGLTGCVAGAESGRDDIVLSLERMQGIVDLDMTGGTVSVQAGTVLQQLQDAVAAEGLYFPLDLGARGSCTIGGNVATNAGGINVLRYGMMRNLVLGLEVVLADGTVVSSMNRMLKNNAGYDLKQLFIGSEGTLGVVTRAVLRLFPQPASRHSALVAAADFDAVTRLLRGLQRDLAGTLSAFELMWGEYFAAVTGPGGHRAPLARNHAFYVVLQTEGTDPERDQRHLEGVLARALDEGLITDAVIPQSEREAAAIWAIRENFDAILEPQPVYLYDVSLPISRMAGYADTVKHDVTCRWPDGRCYVFGHMADGNLHLFVQPNDSSALHADSDAIVYAPLAELGGSVSAEHGIGTEKLSWLPHSRSPAELALMRLMKRSLDPRDILNPGRVLPTAPG